MSKTFTRVPLSRGVELTNEHCTEIEAIQAKIEAGLPVETYEHKNAPFSVSFNFPWLDSKYFYDNDPKGNMPFYMSFCLPPLQETFTTAARGVQGAVAGDAASAVPVLDSISLSFDQRDTGAATVSPWFGTNKVGWDASGNPESNVHYQFPDQHTQWEPNPQEGFLAYARASGLDLKLVIYSKRQTFFDAVEAADAVDISGIAVGATTTITTSSAHGLATGDRVLVEGATSSATLLAGEHVVTVPGGSTTTFTVPVVTTGETEEVNGGKVTKIERLGNADSRVMEEVYSQVFPATVFAGGANPILVSGLNIAFNPYRTYVLALYAPGLHDDRSAFDADNQLPKWEFPVAKGAAGAQTYRFSQHLALISTWVSLNFKMRLTAPDDTSDADYVQNVPSGLNARARKSFSTSAPVVGDYITADDASKGLSTRLETIDKTLVDKLKGGLSGFFSHKHDYTTLLDDAGYDVIAVPMMQGFPAGQLTVTDMEHLPYTNLEKDSRYVDRRLIPIPKHFVVHHVVACLNKIGHKAYGALSSERGNDNVNLPFDSIPASLTRDGSYITYDDAKMPRLWNNQSLYRYEVGLGMVQGEAADNIDYQQIAYVDFDYSRESILQHGSPFLIDTVDLGLGALYPTQEDGTYTKAFEQALIAVPLVSGANADEGRGYFGYESLTSASHIEPVMYKLSQGKPVFVGETTSALDTRTDIGTSAGTASASATAGQEQYLEVRMAIRPVAELSVHTGGSGIDHSTDVVTTSATHDLKEDDAVYFYDTGHASLDGKVFYVSGTSLGTDSFKIKEKPKSLGTNPFDIPSPTVSTGKITVLGQYNSIVMGYGGCFVYIIGKKQLRA